MLLYVVNPNKSEVSSLIILDEASRIWMSMLFSIPNVMYHDPYDLTLRRKPTHSGNLTTVTRMYILYYIYNIENNLNVHPKF